MMLLRLFQISPIDDIKISSVCISQWCLHVPYIILSNPYDNDVFTCLWHWMIFRNFKNILWCFIRLNIILSKKTLLQYFRFWWHSFNIFEKLCFNDVSVIRLWYQVLSLCFGIIIRRVVFSWRFDDIFMRFFKMMF